MSNYPVVVGKIADDYLERVKSQLRPVPAREQEDFLREIQSHVYEAYQQTPGEDDVARILVVLRKLGEPAEVVSDRLPGAMVRSGTKRSLPLYVLGGILIALFGIPLGFGGAGVVVGLLFALSGLVVAYYAITGSILLVGALSMLLGLTRIFLPRLWDQLLMAGFIQINGPPAEFLDRLPPPDQGVVMLLCASVLVASGLGMLWLGRYFLRGLRFLFSLVIEWVRRFAQSIRRKLHRGNREEPLVGAVSFVK
jgi:uncharacterized membrane protein